MVIWGILAGASAVVLSIGIFGLLTERQHRRRRRSLRHIARPPAPDIAYRAVVNARSAFTRSVQAYEEALASASATTGASSVMAGDFASGQVELETMERRKDQRRTRLLEAQRVWEDVRPAAEPASPIPVWIGAGELRGWSLGLIGHEASFLRFEHALDPTCWVVVETRRFRFGPAVGVERLRLGVVVEGAEINQLTDLLQAAMGSPEAAVRPGTSLVRASVRRQVAGRPLFDALRGSVDSSSRLYVRGFEPEVRQESLAYLSSAHGLDLDHTNAGLTGFDEIKLRITSSGPAFLVGAWAGRRPSARIMAGSNHQAWLRSNRTDG